MFDSSQIYDVAQVGLAVPKTGRGGDSHALHAHTHEFRDEEGKTTIATVAWEVFNSPVSQLNLCFSVAIYRNTQKNVLFHLNLNSSILRCSKWVSNGE